MTDQKTAAEKQLENVLRATGKSLDQHVAEVRASAVQKHGQMLKLFKDTYGLGHGNANLLAHAVRTQLDGGPQSDDAMLEAQYAGAKAALRPLFSEVAAMCQALWGDVTEVVQKTGVAYRRNKMFALVQAPSAKRLQIGLNLPGQTKSERAVPMKGMCSHRIDVLSEADIDDELAQLLRFSYENG
ncbi:DUF5655 domain-containing protein [uncultured Tateyamaria sp.]|uniref:DUF5655 domain-containing protein n=1 Tax=uncultured Tateyamaria sp. TaxID=455651 RepID=UPI00262779C9|nr:DUF5655 domain-containing protein [uncultured Tateyamaria sp.]